MRTNFDVVIMGGGLSGSLLAIHILREKPDASVAIIEQSLSFPKKVGESTSDLSALFFRRFKIDAFWETQIDKCGLRFWFNDQQNNDLAHCSEFASPTYPWEGSGIQINRHDLDEHLLTVVKELGATVYRPAQVTDFTYQPFSSTINFSANEQPHTCNCKWLVDATGRAHVIAKKMGWYQDYQPHQVASSWAHFSQLKDLNAWDGRQSIYPAEIGEKRRNATCHFMRKGYWVWYIPLSDQTVSLGVVYNKNLVQRGETAPEAFFNQLLKDDLVLNALTASASYENFVHIDHLSFVNRKSFDQGLVTISESAAFVDPLFSPGMELVCQESLWVAPLIVAHLQTGIYQANKWNNFANRFGNAVATRFQTVERRYSLMGDFTIFSLLTQFELAGYFAGFVLPATVFKQRLKYPVTSNPVINWWYGKYLDYLNRRCIQRSQTGQNNRENLGQTLFSHVRVPEHLWGRLLLPLKLYGVWFWRTIQFEFAHLTRR